MDATQLMLEHLAGPAGAPHAWRSDDQGIYTAQINGTTLLHLHEDQATGRIHMFASPGTYPAQPAAPNDDRPPWQLPADNGGDGDFVNEVRIDARTGRVLLIQSASREKLDATSYQRHLDSFMRWLGAWQETLTNA